MKSRKRIYIACAIACVMLLLAGSLIWLLTQGIGISVGTCIAADNGKYLIVLDNSPIAMSRRSSSNDMFEHLETGDIILIAHDGIAESYPGRTGVYFCTQIGDGAEVSEEIMRTLQEMGWLK